MRKMYVLFCLCLMVLGYSTVIAAVPVTSGLVLQLDPSDVTTISVGGVDYVTSWNDQSGYNNDAIQTYDANRPTLVANATPTGYSAVKFDGTNDFLSIVPNSSLNGGDWTIIAVTAASELESGSGTRRIINLGYADIDPDPGLIKAGPAAYSVIFGSATTGFRTAARNYANTGIFVASGLTPGFAANTFYISASTINSSTSDVWAYLTDSAGNVADGNGLEPYIGGAPAPSVGQGNSVAYVGCGTTGSTSATPGTFFKGSITEVLVYNRVLSDTERESVASYLVNKYTLPKAYNPIPAVGATVYDRATTLQWTPGAGVTSQSIYFSTDEASVTNSDSSALKATLSGSAASYAVDSLVLSTKYYWKIDQVFNGSTVPGTVWNFSVGSYYIVDNIEKYVGTGSSSVAGSLRAAWKDGYSLAEGGLPQLGSNIVLANEVNGVSDTIYDTNTHSGYQSILFAFDNTGNPVTFNYPAGPVTYTPAYPYSEAKIDLSTLNIGTDWTIQGDWNLYLYFSGKATNSTSSPLYLAVEDATGHVSTPVVYPNSSDIAVHGYHTWIICWADLATNGVNLANLSKLYIGLGNRNNPQVGGSGVIYIDDFRMYRQPKLATDLNQDCKIDFKDFALLAEDWLKHAGCAN